MVRTVLANVSRSIRSTRSSNSLYTNHQISFGAAGKPLCLVSFFLRLQPSSSQKESATCIAPLQPAHVVFFFRLHQPDLPESP